MNQATTFDQKPDDGTINFGIGQPSEDLLPVDVFKSASDHFFENAKPQDLNYGSPQGDERFLISLANFLSRQYGKEVSAESLFTTGGNSQAIDFVCSLFSKAGNTIFVEEPSYFLALNIFKDHHLNVVGIPTDAEGIDIDFLERALKKVKPVLFYTIPVYHNPGGHTLIKERRKRLIELSEEHDFLIVADEAYQMLNYYQAPPESFGSMDDTDSVLSLGSFSKILAPGSRLGWIQTSNRLIEHLNNSGLVNSGGNVNQFGSHMVRSVIDSGLLDTHLQKARSIYRSRLEAMDTALKENLGEHATWLCPAGGYFFWLKLSKNVNSGKLHSVATEHKTGFQPGELFSSCGGLKNYIRLSFACYHESDIKEGISRLGKVFKMIIDDQ